MHDNDASARKMIRESGWEITEYLDPGHTMKAFERRVTNFNRRNCHVLRGIEEALKSWMAALLKSNDPVEEKVTQWNNAVNHLSGMVIVGQQHGISPKIQTRLPHSKSFSQVLSLSWRNATPLLQGRKMKVFIGRNSNLPRQMCTGVLRGMRG